MDDTSEAVQVRDAIKQARALDKKAENARELGLDYEPAFVKPTAQEVQNAASNLALMREMWGEPNQPAARVNDEGFIVVTGLLLSPGTLLYTTSLAAQQEYERGVIDGRQMQAQSSVDKAVNAMSQRQWVGLTDERVRQLCGSVPSMKAAVREAEAELKEKNP